LTKRENWWIIVTALLRALGTMYSSGMGVGMVCQKAWRRANLTCTSNFAYSAFAYSKICMHINYIAYSQVLIIVRSRLSGVPLRVTEVCW
jgi:hypothetical protein